MGAVGVPQVQRAQGTQIVSGDECLPVLVRPEADGMPGLGGHLDVAEVGGPVASPARCLNHVLAADGGGLNPRATVVRLRTGVFGDDVLPARERAAFE